MRQTLKKVTREVRFIGRLWLGNVAASEVAFPVGRESDWNREAVLEWLRRGQKVGSKLTPSGDFHDIIDFQCDFSEGEGADAKDWVSGWEKPTSEAVYLDCMGPFI